MEVDIATECLAKLKDLFRDLEKDSPEPSVVDQDGIKCLRYSEKHHTSGIASYQLFAKYISGLFAADFLLTAGFSQEVGVIYRTLHEVSEDITFLLINDVDSVHAERKKNIWITFSKRNMTTLRARFRNRKSGGQFLGIK